MFKFLSEVAQSQTNGDTTSGDARFTETVDARVFHDSIALDVGILSGKGQTHYGTVGHFDTSSIPLGAQVDRTRFALISSATVSTSMTIDVSVLALSTRIDAVDVQYNDARLIYLPDLAVWPLTSASAWTNGSKTGEQDVDIALYENQRDGVKSVSQTWTSLANSNNNTVSNHWIRGAAIGLNSAARVRANVYTAKGSAGSYRKGALLAEGTLTDVSGWGSTVTSRMLPNANTDWYPVEGEVYVTEIELIPGSSESTGALFIGWDSSLTGSVENETAYAATGKKMQGFGGNWASPQWESGPAIRDADHIGTVDTVTAHSAIANYGSYFSSSEFPVDLLTKILSNFKTNIQLALDGRERTDQWIGIRLQNFAADGGEIRSFHSIDASASGSVWPDGKKGWILEIDYTLPFRTVALAGTGVSTLSIALGGSGASSLPLAGGATSSFALVGSGASKTLLSGTGTSVKGLPL